MLWQVIDKIAAVGLNRHFVVPRIVVRSICLGDFLMIS
jgi:hypothetical protein